MAKNELYVLAVGASDALVARSALRKVCFARSLAIGVSVVAILGLMGIMFFSPGASAAGPSVRVVIRTSDGDLAGMGATVRDLGGVVERRLVRTESVVAMLPQDSLDELWSYPSVLGGADEGTDSLVAQG